MEKEPQSEGFSLDQLKAGDERAWEKAYVSLYGLAFNVLKSFIFSLSTEDLEEVASDAVVSLIENFVERAKSIEELKKLVITIAKNRAKDLIDRQRTAKRGSGKVESLEAQLEGKEFDSQAANPSDLADQAERAFLIKDALNQVPAKYADVLTDFYLLGLKQQEIAEKRGLSIGSIGVYLNRGMEALESLLKKYDLL